MTKEHRTNEVTVNLPAHHVASNVFAFLFLIANIIIIVCCVRCSLYRVRIVDGGLNIEYWIEYALIQANKCMFMSNAEGQSEVEKFTMTMLLVRLMPWYMESGIRYLFYVSYKTFTSRMLNTNNKMCVAIVLYIHLSILLHELNWSEFLNRIELKIWKMHQIQIPFQCIDCSTIPHAHLSFGLRLKILHATTVMHGT